MADKHSGSEQTADTVKNHTAHHAEALLNNRQQFSPHLKENTTLRHYKDQLANVVLGRNRLH
jgi:hypothetical protein